MIPRSSYLPRSQKPIPRSPVKKRRTKPRKQAATLRDPEYRRWIASLPCVLLGHVEGHRCGGMGGSFAWVECVHIKGKRTNPDRGNCVPMCHFQHLGHLHQHGPKSFAAAFPGVDLEVLALAYDAVYQRNVAVEW